MDCVLGNTTLSSLSVDCSYSEWDFFFFFKFIWLPWVLDVALGPFAASCRIFRCGVQTLRCGM